MAAISAAISSPPISAKIAVTVAGSQSDWQAQGGRDRSRAWRQFAAGRVHLGGSALDFLRSHIAQGTTVNADEAPHGTICMSVSK